MFNKKYPEVTNPLQPNKDSWEPFRAPTTHSDFKVPAEQALFLSFVIMGLIAALLYVTSDFIAYTEKAIVALISIPGLIALGAIFLWRMGWISDNTVYRAEQAINVDLNRDGIKGEPPHPMTTNEGLNKEAQEIEQEKLKFNKFISMCCAINTDIRTARANGFTDNEYMRYRDYLMRPNIGAAAWNDKSHQQGWQIVKSYDQIMAVVNRLEWLPSQKSK